MEIHSAVYRVFYKELCKAVAKKCFNGNIYKIGKGLGRTLWKNAQGDFPTLFKSVPSVSHDYFYVKYRQFEKLPDSTDDLPDDLMTSAFRYLPSLSNAVKGLKEIIGHGNRAKYMHDQFEIIFKKEIDELLADVNSTLSEETIALQLRIKADYQQEDLEDNLSDRDKRLISDLIREYFQHISSSNYGLAWDLISESGRGYWSHDFNSFKRHQLDKVERGFASQCYRVGALGAFCMLTITWKTLLFQLDFDTNFAMMNYSRKDLYCFLNKLDDFKKVTDSLWDVGLYNFFLPNHFMCHDKGRVGPMYKIDANGDTFTCEVGCLCVWENTKWRIERFTARTEGQVAVLKRLQ